MGNMQQDEGERKPLPARRVRRRILATWLLFGWAMFWVTTAIAQPICCRSFAVGTGNEPAATQQSSDHNASHQDSSPERGPDCPDITAPDVISPTAAAPVSNGFEPAVIPPHAGIIKPAVSEPAGLVRYFSLPPPQHVPLYLRNLRFLI